MPFVEGAGLIDAAVFLHGLFPASIGRPALVIRRCARCLSSFVRGSVPEIGIKPNRTSRKYKSRAYYQQVSPFRGKHEEIEQVGCAGYDYAKSNEWTNISVHFSIKRPSALFA
jgi:hypothetical protein